ncbi:MAG TPA: sigma-70 family RNA polymerase sigma factor, partial [Vicinamibacteria bacterium]|nr:sigma-70 family RNA polymerase sigma factor [Vicinamibacteria bacterium]
MATDAELVQACKGGDPSAFGQIVDRYQSLVCAIAYCGTGDLALSQDLAQETFLAAWKGLGGLREPGKLKAWLAGIVRHLAVSARRRRQPVGLEAAADAASKLPSPLEEVISREQQAVLWRSLEAIPETYREPLVLFYRESRSVARVAEALELSEDAVKQRLSRGRQMLKEQVAAFVESAL